MTSERPAKERSSQQRTHTISHKEAFTCLQCKAEIGITRGIERNHCPQCLYSLHVDRQIPGDRESACKSLMEPVTVSIGKHSSYIVTHRCLTCDKIIINKAAPDDNVDLLISLINKNPKYAV